MQHQTLSFRKLRIVPVVTTRLEGHTIEFKEIHLNKGDTFSLLMESLVARFMDLPDEDIDAQRERIRAQRRWADMELVAIDTAVRLKKEKLRKEAKPTST